MKIDHKLKIIAILISFSLFYFASINGSFATEIPQSGFNSINCANHNTYTAAQTAFMEQHNNVFLFNRWADVGFRNNISPAKYRGIYIGFTEIGEDETDMYEWRAEVPGSPGTYYSHNIGEYTLYLARFWDSNWWPVRLAAVPDIDNGLDWVYLDVMSLKKFDWITTQSPLPAEVDTDAEWRSAILNVASYARANINASIDIAVNSIQNNGIDSQYDGYDVVGTGLGNFAVMEGFANAGIANQVKTMQLAAKAAISQKRVIIKSFFTTDASARLSFVAKYLLSGDGDYTSYDLASSKWAPSPPEYLAENYIEWGHPLDPVPTDIINMSPQSKIYVRRWDSGFISLVNLASTEQTIPSEYLGYKKLDLSGNVQIDINGVTTGKWALIPLNITTIPAYSGIVLYSITTPANPTGLQVQ